jgi:hypothetical protein
MRKSIVPLAVFALAGTAFADFLPVNHATLSTGLTAVPIGSSEDGRNDPVVVYSSVPGPYGALAAASFSHRDDYASTATGAGGIFPLHSIRFVGGVEVVGGILDFFLLDSNEQTVSSFGVQFPNAGNFIWTITLTNPLPAANSGFFQVQTRDLTTGQWFATVTPANPGSNSFSSGYGSTFDPQRIGAFELREVPAPGALALLGLGGLFAARRRR